MANNNNSPLVSIIIVNYKCVDLILDCIKSIYNLNTVKRIEIIVISNSELADEEKRNLLLRKVKVIPLDKNVGFATANNIGAENASGTYLFFLNPDTLFANDVIKELLNASDARSDAGIIGPMTLGINQIQQATAKRKFDFAEMLTVAFPFFRKIWNQTPSVFRPSQTQFVDVVNGSAMFIRKDLFMEVGKMNENYFMYWEENDLCLRVQSRDRKVLYCMEAIIIHLGGETTKSIFLPMEIHKHRSQKIYIATYFPNLLFVNRILGIIAYSWRFAGSVILFRWKKVKQFGSILIWYTFTYK